jgi:DNA/RNA-binding domain of Phe-tRNA-synthetase-like protein
MIGRKEIRQPVNQEIFMLTVTPEWKTAFPGACAGLLVIRDADNPAGHAALAHCKTELEAQLRADFQDKAINNETLEIYTKYFKRFKKTYHVKLQLKSIVQKGKSIPDAQALVQIMFMAELKNMLLTAGHDLDKLDLPLVLDVSRGVETYTLMRGSEQQLKSGDMYIRDGKGILSDVIYGPDKRSSIDPKTLNSVYTVYAPAGIPQQAVLDHLQDMADYVRTASPEARIDLMEIYS